MNFTVEIVLPPVVDGDWARLHALVDVAPGTILIEDPDEPVLIFPVDEDSPQQAASFIEGVSNAACFSFVRGTVYEAPAVDFDLSEEDDLPLTSPLRTRHRWEEPSGPGDSQGALLVTS